MEKELKVDRHWLSHDTPISLFSMLTFFGHKRIRTLKLFVWGWRKWVLCLSATIALTQRVCTCSFSQEPVCPNSLMNTSKQSLKLLRLCLHGYLNQYKSVLPLSESAWLLCLPHSTTAHFCSLCLGPSCTKNSRSQIVIHMRELIYL